MLHSLKHALRESMLPAIRGLFRADMRPVMPRESFAGFSASRKPGLWRDDKGAIMPIVALPMVVLIGMTSLAVEAGLWYVAYREGQNQADAAAMAAAMTLANSGDPTATNDPSQVKGMLGQGSPGSTDLSSLVQGASGSGFGGQMKVTINYPPTKGNFTTNNNAVEAVVVQPRAAGLSSLFGVQQVDIRNRAVATVDYMNGACVLALKTSLTIWGNFSVTAPSCTLASNATGANSIKAGGSASIVALSMNAYGECSGCDDPTIATLTVKPTSYGIKSENRFEKVDNIAWPTYVGSTCDNMLYGTAANVTILNPTYANVSTDPNYPLPTNGGRAYCGGLHLTATSLINLTPGIYIFQEASIKADGGVLYCSTCSLENGVHIVQIDKMGNVDTLSIDGSATVVLNAGLKVPSVPGISTDLTDNLAGVLYYRTKTSQNGNTDEIVVNGNSATYLTGGVYAPNAEIRFNGSSSSDCTVLVAGGITMTGEAHFDGTGCGQIGLKIAKTRIVQLME